jgi:hypothetical protein
LVLVVVLAGLAGACGGEGRLAFRQDDRVEIVQPDDEAEVELPVTIRWESDVPERSDGGPYFAVFLDREPIAPGQSLRVLGDETCEKDPGCVDADYLRDRFVYVTDETSLELETVPLKSGSQRTGARDRHEAIIVLVDGDGRRIGEAAYRVTFGVRED